MPVTHDIKTDCFITKEYQFKEVYTYYKNKTFTRIPMLETYGNEDVLTSKQSPGELG